MIDMGGITQISIVNIGDMDFFGIQTNSALEIILISGGLKLLIESEF